MGFKSLVLILIFAIFTMSCSTINLTTNKDASPIDYSNFNHYCSRNSSKIIFLNGDDLSVNYANVKGDSLYYCAENDTLSIPLADVEKVVIKHWIGAIAEGFFLGFGTTILSAFIFVKLAGVGGDIGPAFVGASVGLLVGFVTFVLGIIYGGKSEYIFNNKANYERIEYYKNYHKIKAKRDSTNLGN